MKVAICGATGETGQSIVNGLLQSPEAMTITALVRPTSIDKPEVQVLKSRGVEVVALDLETPHDEIVKAIAGQEIVISCIVPCSEGSQIALADAAKAARVQRFVPSAFGPICPPSGVLILREIKEAVLRHIMKIDLPYTVVDVGWWYQNSVPRLPSGKIDYSVKFPLNKIAGTGHFQSALTDIRDIGRYVERIIRDERTLNKSVFVYNEILTQQQIFTTLEMLSGETIQREYITEEEIKDGIHIAQERYEQDDSVANLLGLSSAQYANSIWLRGDNLPGKAASLGYLNGKELYPGLKYVRFMDYVKELVTGKGSGVYMNRVFGFEKYVQPHREQ